MKRSIPILMYHHISPDREITPDGLARQMRFLLDEGYRSLGLDELENVIAGRTPEPTKGFVVTLDDGYLDNWLYAFPIFKKLSVQATIYGITSRIESHSTPRTITGPLDTCTQERGPGNFVAWSEVRAMIASGLITFGSHTHTHRDFIRAQPYRDLTEELRRSKSLIEEGTGKPCQHLAWPWGDYETLWTQDVSALGYITAATTLGGANGPGTNPLELRRFKVSHESLEWLDRRLLWTTHPLRSRVFGLVYGADKRFKTWRKQESPYSHG